jgi:hypothetical protein
VKELLRAAPDDPAWVGEVERIRAALLVEDRRWND